MQMLWIGARYLPMEQILCLVDCDALPHITSCMKTWQGIWHHQGAQKCAAKKYVPFPPALPTGDLCIFHQFELFGVFHAILNNFNLFGKEHRYFLGKPTSVFPPEGWGQFLFDFVAESLLVVFMHELLLVLGTILATLVLMLLISFVYRQKHRLFRTQPERKKKEVSLNQNCLRFRCLHF